MVTVGHFDKVVAFLKENKVPTIQSRITVGCKQCETEDTDLITTWNLTEGDLVDLIGYIKNVLPIELERDHEKYLEHLKKNPISK